MCGIAGIFSHGPQAASVDRAELLRVRDRMAARGPDAEGAWISEDGRVGLAHRRLAILDLSPLGAQPMQDPESGDWVVFNGEIYNFHELRDEMVAAGSRFRSNSDTEVLLAMYRRMGPAMLPRLRGMFAFAIWNSKAKELFLARDPLGIKPLYWSDTGGTFRFASQVKALLQGGSTDRSPDPAGTVGFFLWGSVPEPFTLYRGIRSLPAGHCMTVRPGSGPSERSYFKISDLMATEAARPCSAEEASERLRSAVEESVRYHLVSDVPVGVFLSAGIDSTTIATHASRHLAGRLNTLALGFQEFRGTGQDETPLARDIADCIGSSHVERTVSRSDFEAELDRILDQMDQPSIDGVNTYFVSRAAREAGWKVALSGLGGDELFRGYPTFHDLPRRMRLVRRAASVPGVGRLWRHLSRWVAERTGLIKVASLLEMSGDLPSAYRLARGLFLPWEIERFMDRDAVRVGLDRLQTTASLRRCIEGIDDQQRQISGLEMRWYMLNQLLRDSDWASMAHALELRVPLVDVRLIREVMSIANAGHALSKVDLFRTACPPLPESILNRRKTGFGIPVYDWSLASSRGASDRTHGSRAWAMRIHDHFLHESGGI